MSRAIHLVTRQDSRGQEFGEGSGPVDAASSERPPVFRAPDDSPQVVKRDGASWVVVERGEVVSRLREARWGKLPHSGYMGHVLTPRGRTMLVLTSELPERKAPYSPEAGINKATATDRYTDAWLRSQGERVGNRGRSKGILLNYKRDGE